MSFRPIAIDISPNTNWRDYLLAARLLLAPWRWRQTAPVYELEQSFKRQFGFQACAALDSGRSALYLALKLAGIGPGDEVILQAFTCSVVPLAILWTGAKPVYADIDKTLNIDPEDMKRKITPKTKAVIVQHTFGYPADMERILKLQTSKSKFYIIEDCAHSLGAKYQGRLVGTLGDMAVFSFGRDKVISSVYGGLLGVKEERLAKRLQEMKLSLKPMPGQKIFQGLFHPVAFSVILPLYNWGIGKFLAWSLGRVGLIPRAITAKEKRLERPSYRPSRLAGALARLSLSQLKRLEQFNYHRQGIAKIYFRQLIDKNNVSLLPKPRLQDEVIYLRFPVLVKKPEKLIKMMVKQGIYLGNWYRPVVAPAYQPLKRLGYSPGQAPQAERFSKQIINLPTYPSLTKKQAKKLVLLLSKMV